MVNPKSGNPIRPNLYHLQTDAKRIAKCARSSICRHPCPDGSLGNPTLVAGSVNESIFQPEWSPEGGLHFVSDRTGWWNLYRWRDGRVEPLCPMPAEFGLPQWVFGMSTYAFESANRIVCTYIEKGYSRLAILDAMSRILTEEISRTEESYQTAQFDSRLGYECEMDYIYSPMVIEEKLQMLHKTLENEIPMFRVPIEKK